MQRKAIIIGAGIGGLATAIRLQAKGYQVSVLEANPYPGGKLHQKEQDGFRFDMGPSLFTMPWLVDELFTLCKKDPRAYFTYQRQANVCQYFWEDGSIFRVPANREDFIAAAHQSFGEPKEVLERYLNNNQKKYELTKSLFLEQSLHRLNTYLSKATLKAIAQIGSMGIGQSLDSYNQQHFSNPKLVQLFNRYATYNGSSPYKTPGIMSMIPHLEMDLGTYFPKGGIYQITAALYQLAQEIGINFKFSCKVERIIVDQKKVTGVATKDATITTPLVISNADVYPTYTKLLADQKAPTKILAQERSSSALIFYWGINRTFAELDLHNIFFSEDYQSEFDHIFRQKTLFKDPTIYVHIASKESPKDAPEGQESWFVMINAPGNYNQNWEQLKKEARANIIHKLERILKTDIESLITTEMVLEPKTIASTTSSYRGALYGAASNSKFAAFLRHPNFSNNIKGLYFCGGSVHPGGGIPLCLLSAKITADLIDNTN